MLFRCGRKPDDRPRECRHGSGSGISARRDRGNRRRQFDGLRQRHQFSIFLWWSDAGLLGPRQSHIAAVTGDCGADHRRHRQRNAIICPHHCCRLGGKDGLRRHAGCVSRGHSRCDAHAHATCEGRGAHRHRCGVTCRGKPRQSRRNPSLPNIFAGSISTARKVSASRV